MTDNDRSLMTDVSVPFCIFHILLEGYFHKIPENWIQVTGKLLHPTTLFRTFAPAIERKLLLHQMSVLIDVRRQTSITTQRRARNGASGELKYQPSKHTQSMINYSITMRSVNSNLLEINQAKSRINQAATIRATLDRTAMETTNWSNLMWNTQNI